MPKETIYTVGGTVQAGGGLYIKRKADDELLELCRQGEFAFILSSRQVGKSSLMVRTAQQLEKENIRSVTIDLSAIGVNVSQDEWYLGILNEVANSLNLETDIFGWWKQYAELGPAQRLTNFFRDILLKEVKEPIVLFFDEIDSTLSIPFSDDFYVAIRAAYNARSTIRDFKRLSFVLVGVATPGDLISDNRRTPFNIGHRVEVSDFTLAEALPLANGLGEQAIQVLTWVFQYTGGHPYLTQRLCAHLAALRNSPNEETVKNAVERLFTGEQGKQDNNLQFVRDMLSKRSPDVTRVLKIYKDIRSGKKVTDDERSIAKAHLKLSGLVRSEKGILRVRNEIYNSVFDLQWIQEHMPKNWQKIALISVSASLGVLILAALAVFINDFFVGTRVNESITSFYFTTSSEQRLLNLAEIYRQKGILSNRDSSIQAAQLFYGLSSAEDQLGLFRVYGIEQNPAIQEDLVTVVSHLYVTAANVDPGEDNTELLQAMHDVLSRISGNAAAADLKEEIAAWVAGRNHASSENYDAALASYNAALSLNPGNHATLYERAKVYVELEQYNDALNDLDAAIAGAKQSLPEIAPTSTPTVTPSPASATPNPAEAQTRESPNMLSTAAAQTVQAQLTQTTTFSTPTATATHTPTATPTLTPAPTPQPTNISRAEKFESNFTTLIDVINAVRALIEGTPGLQVAAQGNGEISYTNLQSVGLIRDFPTQAPATGLLREVLDRGYLMVATDPNYEPASFLNTEGTRPRDTKCPADALTTAEMQGFDVDVAIALGEKLGVETCFATPSWDAVTAGSWGEQWDISIGSMTITTARQEVLDFSIPYYYYSFVVAVRADSGFTSLADLQGQGLCVGAFTPEEDWLNGGGSDFLATSIYATPPPNVTVISRDTDQGCAQDLAAGQNQQSGAEFIGYVSEEGAVEQNIAEGTPVVKLDGPVFSQGLAAAFDKASSLSTDSLRTEVNKLFTAMHNDGRLSKLSGKWLGADLTQAPDLRAAVTQQPTSQPLVEGYQFAGEIDYSADQYYGARSAAIIEPYLYVLHRAGELKVYDVSQFQSDEALIPDDALSTVALPGMDGMVYIEPYLYAFGFSGITLIDISSAENPQPLSVISLDFAATNLTYTSDRIVTIGEGGLTFFQGQDVTSEHIHQSPIANGWSAGIIDNILYAGDLDGLIHVYDISDLTSIKELNVIELGDTPYHIYALGNRLLVCGDSLISLWDIENRENPAFIDEFASSGRGCVLDNDWLTTADGQVVNVLSDRLEVASTVSATDNPDGFPYFGSVSTNYLVMVGNSVVHLYDRNR